ncbi:MAG TPA: HEAT repeat domain-containing protein [Ignavibacteriaceae bacterium]|nr:HEAT repeat domain-containing protein [Ignavibacteriaceae bacterium]
MNHKKYKILIDEYFFGDINNAEKNELEEHLKNCALCRSEFNSTKVLHEALLKDKLPDPDENILTEARKELRISLRAEKMKLSLWKRISGKFSSSFFLTPQLAAAAFSFLIIGLIIGYFVFNSPGTVHYSLENIQQQNGNTEAMLSDDMKINNIRFINKNSVDGTVDFTFDAVKPVHIKGKINDPEIQSILTYSMLNEDNPGTRLNTISLINSSSQPQQDNDIKNALLSVIKFDNNQGVRWEAMKLLNKFKFDDQIKKTLLYVLQNDSSSGMRIEAMNKLVEASKSGSSFDRDDLSVLRQKGEQDDNNYIRYQAKTVLKEYK